MIDSGTMIDSNSVAVILCAGKGTRMKSDCPKILNTILGKTMIAHIMDVLNRTGFERSIIVCNSENIDLIKTDLKKYRTEVLPL